MGKTENAVGARTKAKKINPPIQAASERKIRKRRTDMRGIIAARKSSVALPSLKPDPADEKIPLGEAPERAWEEKYFPNLEKRPKGKIFEH